MITHIPHKMPKVVDTTLANGARYYKTPEGNKYPSVTTMLSHKEKPYLQNWRMMLGEKKANREMNRCAKRGTAVHLMAERYVNNQEAFDDNDDVKHVALFNKLKMRLNGIDNVLCQEGAVYSDELQLAGRIDCVAEYKGTLSIIDYKTSTNIKKRDMIGDYFLQGAAYSMCWLEMFDVFIEDIVILIAVEKGLVPTVFKAKTEDHLAELWKRNKDFYKDFKGF
jgi:genome maintenance exonuclease 1